MCLGRQGGTIGEATGQQCAAALFFSEKNRAAHARLKEFADNVMDAKIETRNATLEESIPDITDSVQRGGAKAFPFIFIDQTGWTGFGMETIAPLLRLNPSEVLINFLTGHIRRFLESPSFPPSSDFGVARVWFAVHHRAIRCEVGINRMAC